MLATALSVSQFLLIAHDEARAEPSNNLLDSITHQSVFVALIICGVVLLALYGILVSLKLNVLNRLLLLIPAALALSLLFYQHQPIVSTILLSGGFILTFLLAFTMLRGK